MVTAAQKRWPEASAESLESGRGIFEARCKTCHSLPAPADHATEAWKPLMAKMGKLAELDEGQSESVLRYVVAVREAE
jgi:cytochrome c5